MSVTVENALAVPYRIVGNKKETVTNVTCSEKYVEGGEVVTPKNLGLSQKVEPGAICTIKTLGSGSTVNLASVSYNPATEKLILRDETPAEVASEAEIKKPVIQITAQGV
jgi:hypothetical protein